MPVRKQQKLSYALAAKKGITTNDEENTPSPMEDVEVHNPSTADNGSTASQTDESESNNEDDATVAVENRPPPIQYTRCDFKIGIKGTTSDHYLEALQNIQSLFTQIQKEDEHATIVPWSSKSTQPHLSLPSEIPSEEDDAADYFRGLNPRDDRTGHQPLWFKMQLGHVLPLEEIQRSLSRFLSKRKWTVTKLQLQVERTICVGMLQYSHGNMDFENLARILENAIDLPVQLRWRVISIGWRSGPIDEENKIRAIHIEVEHSEARNALSLLSNKFGKTMSTLPGGWRMRFFPEFTRVRSVANQNKIKEMRKRQGHFLNIIEKIYSKDLHLLDHIHTYKDPNTNQGVALPTLRKMVLGIKSFQPGLEHLSLFHSVDTAWAPRGRADRGYCFLVMPHLQCEGAMMVQNLLPYLRFKHGKEVEAYFTQECIDANVGIEWDDDNKCVKSEIENNLTDDSQDADLIGLNQALKFIETSKQAIDAQQSSQPSTSPPTRPTPQAPQLDTPLNPNSAMVEYYKPAEDDLSSIGFSATQTIQDGSSLSHTTTNRPTLGQLQGKVIQTNSSSSHAVTNSESSIPAPSAVFNPVVVQDDAQTTVSSVTFGSILGDMERRQAKRDAQQNQLFEKMLTMMSSLTKNQQESPSLEKAGEPR